MIIRIVWIAVAIMLIAVFMIMYAVVRYSGHYNRTHEQIDEEDRHDTQAT